MIDVREALRIVLEHARRLPPVRVPLQEAAGAVLAEEVASDVDLPPFDRSMMDGYAVRAEDVQDAPASLRLVGEVAAGSVPAMIVGPGQAARIFTGAMLPAGADAVQIVERSQEEGARVILYEPVERGRHVSRRGTDLRCGETALARDTLIGPAEIGVLAAAGSEKVLVTRRPRVAILTTGDELVEVGEVPRKGQIRNSNSPAAAAAVEAAGAVPVPLGIVRDREADLDRALDRALREDFVLLTGGVSAGRYDLVPDALKRAGVSIHFDRVSIQPGKPFTFGTRGETLVCGLPGNPVSALTCFQVFVLPALRKAVGRRNPVGPRIEAILQHPVERDGHRTGYLVAWTEAQGDRLVTTALKSHGSADIVSQSRGNSLLVAPRGESTIPKGASVEVLLHADFLER